MNTKVTTRIASVLLILVLAALGIQVLFFPKQLQPDVLPIRLLSVARTGTGTEAVFELRNESGTSIDVWPAASLNVGTQDRFETQNTLIDPISIEEDQAARITVKVPADRDWQLMIRVARHGAREGTIVFSDWASQRGN
jgi:hypothetical protein